MDDAKMLFPGVKMGRRQNINVACRVEGCVEDLAVQLRHDLLRWMVACFFFFFFFRLWLRLGSDAAFVQVPAIAAKEKDSSVALVIGRSRYFDE